MNHTFDALVVGAGFAGAVTARELAERGNLRVLVLERRDHIGGNAYDCLDQAGVLIHQYGPHIFHTNNKRVFDYLSRFTQWRDYQHRVIANIPDEKAGGRMTYPVPFNLTSLETAFGLEEGRRLGDKLLEAYGPERKVTILELRQNADPEIAALADYVYEHVFVHYTMKQWGQTPEEIDPNTTARVPVFLSRDDRYFQDAYQGMPLEGYTPLFERLLDHLNITVELGTDALKRLAVGPLSGCGHSVAAEGLVLGIAALGEGFVIRLVFPDQDGGVAVGQAIETVVRDLARIADLVFPDYLAVPRILAEQAVPAAKVHGTAGDLLRAEQVPVGKQFRIEGGMVMLPGMDNIAFHIDEVGLSAAWILDFVHNP